MDRAFLTVYAFSIGLAPMAIVVVSWAWGGPLLATWPFVAMALFCWTLGAALQIRGRPAWETWARALGVAVVIVVAAAVALATAVVSELDGYAGLAAFGIGWIALVIRPVRRLVLR